jgi:predicted SpoU family rRNA methylase
MGSNFHQLDDLVLQLKGLVLVRKVREERGADVEELTMYGAEIDRVRDRLAGLMSAGQADQAAA